MLGYASVKWTPLLHYTGERQVIANLSLKSCEHDDTLPVKDEKTLIVLENYRLTRYCTRQYAGDIENDRCVITSYPGLEITIAIIPILQSPRSQKHPESPETSSTFRLFGEKLVKVELWVLRVSGTEL